ncbi:MAG: hypothetical protein JSS15_10220 [Proteobacteria bacterium]|nr:hypothetical protein [Pseudomonadota bacterium]
MSSFVLGTAAIIGLTGLFMIAAPQRAAARLGFSLPTNGNHPFRIFRMGGCALIALSVLLLIQLLWE